MEMLANNDIGLFIYLTRFFPKVEKQKPDLRKLGNNYEKLFYR